MPPSKIRKQVNPLILIVEDNRVNQLLLMNKFEKQELRSILLAKDGREAIDLALKNNPDLILMDIQLPDMNGNSVILSLREKKFQGQIVALSADAAPEDKERSFKAGANGYITKPINFDTFFTRIDDFLNLADGRKETPRSKGMEEKNTPDVPHPEKINPHISAAAKKIFIEDGRGKLQILAAALAHADDESQMERIKAIAHEYKGNAGYFGLKELERIARELDLGFGNQAPDEHLVRLTRQLVTVVENIIHESA